MKNIGRLRALGVMVGVVLGVLGVRAVNALRYPEREAPEVETDAPPAGVRVTEVREGDVNGYHIAPERPSRRGLVIVFGGSEGSPDYARAAAIAARGQEVLALRFFGQANQPATLAGIPVEFFGRALAWAESQGASLDPLTVIGTSKGAELSLLLPSFYDEIDNVVLFAPGRHAYQGLDFTRPRSSWTHAGVDVPYVPFARGDPASGLAMALAWLFGTPVNYRATYESAGFSGRGPSSPRPSPSCRPSGRGTCASGRTRRACARPCSP